MIPVRTLSMMLFQGGDAPGTDHMQWLVVFVGIIAFCSFVQFLVLVGAAIGALKAWKSISAEIQVVKQKAMPIVATVQGVVDDARPMVKKVTAKVQEIVEDATPKVKVVTAKVQEIMEDATPKVKTITANVADISDVARTKVHDFQATLDKANETVREVNDKTRAQVSKVDGMVSSTLKATSDIGNTIHRGIRMPVMEVAGVVNALKAGLDVLVGRSGSSSKGSAGESGTGPGGFRGAREGSSAPGSAPGPVRVPPADPASSSVSSHPSSNVAPSPGAAEVVDKYGSEKIKTIY